MFKRTKFDMPITCEDDFVDVYSDRQRLFGRFCVDHKQIHRTIIPRLHVNHVLDCPRVQKKYADRTIAMLNFELGATVMLCALENQLHSWTSYSEAPPLQTNQISRIPSIKIRKLIQTRNDISCVACCPSFNSNSNLHMNEKINNHHAIGTFPRNINDNCPIRMTSLISNNKQVFFDVPDAWLSGVQWYDTDMLVTASSANTWSAIDIRSQMNPCLKARCEETNNIVHKHRHVKRHIQCGSHRHQVVLSERHIVRLWDIRRAERPLAVHKIGLKSTVGSACGEIVQMHWARDSDIFISMPNEIFRLHAGSMQSVWKVPPIRRIWTGVDSSSTDTIDATVLHCNRANKRLIPESIMSIFTNQCPYNKQTDLWILTNQYVYFSKKQGLSLTGKFQHNKVFSLPTGANTIALLHGSATNTHINAAMFDSYEHKCTKIVENHKHSVCPRMFITRIDTKNEHIDIIDHLVRAG